MTTTPVLLFVLSMGVAILIPVSVEWVRQYRKYQKTIEEAVETGNWSAELSVGLDGFFRVVPGMTLALLMITLALWGILT